MNSAQNKNKIGIWIFLSVLLILGTVVGLFIYTNNQANIRQQNAIEQENKKSEAEKEEEQNESTNNLVDYINCKTEATTAKDNDLRINSKYETTDENGGTIYHGNADMFNQIEQSYQQALTRCSNTYQ